MVKTTTKAVVGVLVASVVGATTLGVPLWRSLYRSGQEQLRRKARELVDPAIELQEAVREGEKDLPRIVADIKFAVRDSETRLGALTQALQEKEEGLMLINQDLESLAVKVRNGEGYDLRGRALGPEQAREEAARLLAKRKQYESTIKAQKALLDRMQRQKQELERQLAKAERALADFADKAKQVQTKTALVKAAESLEEIQRHINADIVSAVPSSLEQLDRNLDRRLQENEELARLRDSLGTPDEYAEALREQGILAELEKLYPTVSPGDDEK